MSDPRLIRTLARLAEQWDAFTDEHGRDPVAFLHDHMAGLHDDDPARLAAEPLARGLIQDIAMISVHAIAGGLVAEQPPPGAADDDTSEHDSEVLDELTGEPLSDAQRERLTSLGQQRHRARLAQARREADLDRLRREWPRLCAALAALTEDDQRLWLITPIVEMDGLTPLQALEAGWDEGVLVRWAREAALQLAGQPDEAWMPANWTLSSEALEPHRGRWVAINEGLVVASRRNAIDLHADLIRMGIHADVVLRVPGPPDNEEYAAWLDRREAAAREPVPPEALDPYAGQWVATKGAEVIAHAAALRELMSIIERDDLRADSVFRVPRDEHDAYP